METFYIIPLTCSICGITVGEHRLSSKFGWTGKETPEEIGFVDSRCSADEQTHGKFRDLVEEYRTKVKDDGLEAENFVKKNRKKGDFARHLAVVLAEKTQIDVTFNPN